MLWEKITEKFILYICEDVNETSRERRKTKGKKWRNKSKWRNLLLDLMHCRQHHHIAGHYTNCSYQRISHFSLVCFLALLFLLLVVACSFIFSSFCAWFRIHFLRTENFSFVFSQFFHNPNMETPWMNNYALVSHEFGQIAASSPIFFSSHFQLFYYSLWFRFNLFENELVTHRPFFGLLLISLSFLFTCARLCCLLFDKKEMNKASSFAMHERLTQSYK